MRFGHHQTKVLTKSKILQNVVHSQIDAQGKGFDKNKTTMSQLNNWK